MYIILSNRSLDSTVVVCIHIQCDKIESNDIYTIRLNRLIDTTGSIRGTCAMQDTDAMLRYSVYTSPTSNNWGLRLQTPAQNPIYVAMILI